MINSWSGMFFSLHPVGHPLTKLIAKTIQIPGHFHPNIEHPKQKQIQLASGMPIKKLSQSGLDLRSGSQHKSDPDGRTNRGRNLLIPSGVPILSGESTLSTSILPISSVEDHKVRQDITFTK